MRRALAGMLLLLSVLTLFAVVGLIAGCGGNGGKPNTAPDKPFVYPTVTAALSRGSDFPYGAIKYEETPGRKMIVFAIRSDWKGGMADNRFLGYVHGDVRRYLGNSYKSEYGPVKRDTIMGDYITLTATIAWSTPAPTRPSRR